MAPQRTLMRTVGSMRTRDWYPYEFKPVGVPMYVKWSHGQTGEGFHDGLMLNLNRRSPEGYLLGSTAEDATPTHWAFHPEVDPSLYADALKRMEESSDYPSPGESR